MGGDMGGCVAGAARGSGRVRGRAWGSRAGQVLRSERAQATVEFAIVAPVLIVLALIVYNLMLFASACARFDRVAPDIVVAHAVSSTGEDAGSSSAETVKRELEAAMDGYDVEVSVEVDAGGEGGGSMLALVGSLRTYTCAIEMAPRPGGLSIAGVDLGAPAMLVHERSVTVDPWRPGVVV